MGKMGLNGTVNLENWKKIVKKKKPKKFCLSKKIRFLFSLLFLYQIFKFMKCTKQKQNVIQNWEQTFLKNNKKSKHKHKTNTKEIFFLLFF